VRAAMETMSIDGSPAGALNGYLVDSFRRFLHTWGLAKDLKGKALELGANPYFTTWLLTDFTELDLQTANYFGSGDSSGQQTVTLQARGQDRVIPFRFDHFNIEDDRFPYEDATFDVVFFCEILEHLVQDPTKPLREINRILKPEGTLILTTPNAAQAANVLALIDGHSIWDIFSGHGLYGRHSREYSFGDVHRILEHTGFRVEHRFTADSFPFDHEARLGTRAMRKLLKGREETLGQYHFFRSKKTGSPTPGLPAWLFRDFPVDQMSR